MTARTRWRVAASTFVVASALWTVAVLINNDPLPTFHVIVAGVNGSGNADGADGVHFADVNMDGVADAVVPYEQGNKVSLSLLDASGAAQTVMLPTNLLVGGEDAQLDDVDQDTGIDIIVASEGNQRVVLIFGPVPPQADSVFLNPSNWTRVDLTASINKRAMRVVLHDLAGDDSPEIVVGEKESDPCVARSLGYYSSETPRVAASWTHTAITPVGWVQQLVCTDDINGQTGCVYSDKERTDCPVNITLRGIAMVVSDGQPTPSFTRTQLYSGNDVRWFDLVDWSGDGVPDVIACQANPSHSFILVNDGTWSSWTTIEVPQPVNVGQCQHAVLAELDTDGADDLVFSYSNAYGDISGVVGLVNSGTRAVPVWTRKEISGTRGSKFDAIIMHNINPATDATLDVCTTEQHEPDTNGPGDGFGCYLL